MRDIDRIEPCFKRLEKIWKEYPDLRLGQLIGNVYQTCSISSYYMEDDEYLKKIEEFYGVKTNGS